MGSWSVYCGISQIAITSGQQCVLLPLKKSQGNYYYSEYLPATLPIFGEYDDYGGIENVVKDENTKLIEEHFGCTIEDFCQFFTRGCVRDDEDDFPKDLKKNEEMKGWTFMFIDRKVYDFMSTHGDKGEIGHHPMGNPKILEFMGFVKQEEKSGDKRYEDVWKYNDFIVWSDGEWCQIPNSNAAIYNVDGSYSALSDHIELNDNMKLLAKKSTIQVWHLMDKKWLGQNLFGIIGKSSYSAFDDDFYDFFEKSLRESGKTEEEIDEIIGKRKNIPLKTIMDKYVNDMENFGCGLSELSNIRHNLYPMSGDFKPHQLYVTPQCGEYGEHQILLDEFAKINKEIATERGYFDDEE